MPINADLIRELLARVENPKLDFKRDEYDWSVEGNNELAKDLMAIANGLPLGSEPGYILVGVDEAQDGTGVVVGVPPGSHLDDAKLHQKVSGLLNRTPQFSFMPVKLDGLEIGVYEIRPGGRPFYPLRDGGNKKPLRRFEPRVRNGSATDVASPDQVLAWGREDDPVHHEVRQLELDKLRAETELRPYLCQNGVSRTGEKWEVKLVLRNDGEAFFDVVRAWSTIEFTELYYEVIKKTGATNFPDVPPLVQNVHFGQTPVRLRAGQERDAKLTITRELITAHVAKSGLPLPQHFAIAWLKATVEVECGAGSRTQSAKWDVHF